MCQCLATGDVAELAKGGDELVLTEFPDDCNGFTYYTESRKSFWDAFKAFFLKAKKPIVVCVPPSAALLLKEIDAPMQKRFGLPERVAVKFIQVCADGETFSDGLQFPSGKKVFLWELKSGLRAKVLSTDDEDPLGELAEEIDFSGIVTPGGNLLGD